MSCVPSLAKIYYTVDGSTPTMEEGTLYTEPVKIPQTTSIKAISVLGQYQSGTATFVAKVAAPTFDPAGGEVEQGTEVTITCATVGAKIYYTVDGSAPTAESAEYLSLIHI